MLSDVERSPSPASTHSHSSIYDRPRQDSASSIRSCEDFSGNQTLRLWECMLNLQERYACYNSTRIDLALNDRDHAADLMPNRFIIDTLNNSLHDLPSEGWQMLYRCLEDDKPKKFWQKL